MSLPRVLNIITQYLRRWNGTWTTPTEFFIGSGYEFEYENENENENE